MKSLVQLVCCILFALPLHAEYFVIKSYDVQMKVYEDAYFDVIETINVEFTEPRRGIFRNIPYRYYIDGASKKVSIRNINVEGWKQKVTSGNGLVTIRIGDKDIFVDGSQEYVIKYRVYDAFNWTESHTEFYWNLVGTQWEVPIETVAFSIEFPEQLSLNKDDFRVFTGKEGQTQQNASIKYRGKNLYGSSTKSLAPGEGLTVAAKLPKDLIIQVSPFQSFWQNNNLLGIPAALMALFAGIWWKKGRNPKIPSINEDIYYPPQGYSPAEMGVLIDGRADNRDIISLLPWWAEQGLIQIRNRPTDHPDELDMRLERLQDLPADAPEYQHSIFNELFQKGDTVYLNEFTNIFYSTMGTARSQVKKVLKDNELYDRDSYRLFHSGWMVAIFIICLIGGVLTMVLFQQIFTGILLILLGVTAFVFHFLRPKLSDYGRDLTAKLVSFRETIKNPDRDTISKLLEKDPKYFEHVFPYAIAFGLDNSWLKQTRGLFHTPIWYGYYGHHDAHYHGHNTQPTFQNFTEGFQPKSIQQVFTSAPVQSSSGSGGGGSFSGGSSGGGFGGGGGGSW